MKIINRIQIEYYRSLKKVTIKDINHVNVFSGKNDIGKSNVLNALDTFFNKKAINFADDYNKERLEEVRRDSIRGKQYFKINIEFNNPGSYKTLPPKFMVSKSWDRNGNVIDQKDNFDSLFKSGRPGNTKIEIARRSLTGFLNKIRYTYIPAIRDERFFSYLLNMLQETIFEVEEKRKNQTFQDNITNFNNTISKLTEVLNKEFEEVSGISSNLSFPNSVSEIFQRLIIDTKDGNHEIPLRLRGDGIRLRYIPTILNYISDNSRGFEIWGFDEPENSCEYALTQKISEQFIKNYSVKNQIFVASHSFHFISADAANVSKYRVFREPSNSNTNVVLLDDHGRGILSEELGILAINQELAAIYERYNKEMIIIEKTRDELKATRKPFIIFEGKTDNALFETAYQSLKKRSIDRDFTLCEHQTAQNGGAIGSSATFINQFLYNHITKMPTNNYVIGIFDLDKTGIDEIKALNKTFDKIDSPTDMYFAYRHKVKKNVFAITLVAPPHRTDFFHKQHPEYCYISTEMLFQDKDIRVDNRQYPTLFDKRVYSFSGNKDAFAENIETTKLAVDFSGFEFTFELIDNIVNGKFS